MRPSELNLKAASCDERQRYPARTPTSFDHDHVVLDTRDPPGHIRLAIDGFGRDNLSQPAGEPTVIPEMTKWPVEAWRRNLQYVGLVNRILGVEDRAHILAHPAAIGNADRVLRKPWPPFGGSPRVEPDGR